MPSVCWLVLVVCAIVVVCLETPIHETMKMPIVSSTLITQKAGPCRLKNGYVHCAHEKTPQPPTQFQLRRNENGTITLQQNGLYCLLEHATHSIRCNSNEWTRASDYTFKTPEASDGWSTMHSRDKPCFVTSDGSIKCTHMNAPLAVPLSPDPMRVMANVLEFSPHLRINMAASPDKRPSDDEWVYSRWHRPPTVIPVANAYGFDLTYDFLVPSHAKVHIGKAYTFCAWVQLAPTTYGMCSLITLDNHRPTLVYGTGMIGGYDLHTATHKTKFKPGVWCFVGVRGITNVANHDRTYFFTSEKRQVQYHTHTIKGRAGIDGAQLISIGQRQFPPGVVSQFLYWDTALTNNEIEMFATHTAPIPRLKAQTLDRP